jgi:ubiquitin-conjugating enzyme (huntingtin interacting protein 2)
MERLRKELSDISKDTVSGVTAEPYGDNIKHLKASIKGPVDTPYQGGVFAVDIVVPDTYPFEPPKMRFMTKVWHPNISSQTGAICLDILKDQWSPALTIKVRECPLIDAWTFFPTLRVCWVFSWHVCVDHAPFAPRCRRR